MRAQRQPLILLPPGLRRFLIVASALVAVFLALSALEMLYPVLVYNGVIHPG